MVCIYGTYSIIVIAAKFISQMVQLWQDPEGKNVFEKTRPTSDPSQRSRSQAGTEQAPSDGFEAVNKNSSHL